MGDNVERGHRPVMDQAGRHACRRPSKAGFCHPSRDEEEGKSSRKRRPALFCIFFRGNQKILSVLGCAAFARLTPWPNSWHDRAMKAGFISIFRAFHLNPPSESHTPDSPDSLIFFASGRESGAFPDRRVKLQKWRGGVPIPQQSQTRQIGPTPADRRSRRSERTA